MFYCFNCGNKIENNERFCSNCGIKQKKPTDISCMSYFGFGLATIILALLLSAGIIKVLELIPETTKEISSQNATGERPYESPDKKVNELFIAIENGEIDTLKHLLHDDDLNFLEEQGYTRADYKEEFVMIANFMEQEYGPNWSNNWDYETIDATRNHALVRITTNNNEEEVVKLERIDDHWKVLLGLSPF